MAIIPPLARPWSRRLNLFPHERRVIVCSADGDRTDESIIRQGRSSARGSIESSSTRTEISEDGRGGRDFHTCSVEDFTQGSRVRSVETIPGEAAAIDFALKDLAPGDLIVFQCDEDVQITRSLVEFGLNHVPGPDLVEARAVRPAKELQPAS